MSHRRFVINARDLWSQSVTYITVAIVLCSLLLPQQMPGQESGALTIMAVPDEWSKLASPGAYCEQSNLSIRIDSGETIPWPRKKPIPVKDLALDRSHLIAVRCSGKPLQAVKFRFGQFNSVHVCVSYDPYGGIRLFDYTTRGWGCKKETPSSNPE